MPKTKIISYFDKINNKGYVSYSARQLSLAIGMSRTTIFNKLSESGYYQDDKIVLFCTDRQSLIKGLWKNKGHFAPEKEIVSPTTPKPYIPQVVQIPVKKSSMSSIWEEARSEINQNKKK